MARITLTIDGNRVKVKPGTTILQAAQGQGVIIPTLCHVQGCAPTGVCRVCIVEVVGYKKLVGSCHTPVEQGMVVYTKTPKVLHARRMLVELMLSAHTGDCVTDTNAQYCALHNLASEWEVEAPKFSIDEPRWYPVEDKNPYVRRNLSKCIMCRRCVVACAEIAQKDILSVGYRGFKSKIVTGFDEALTSDVCRDCGFCIEHCPTGALSKA